MNRMKFILGVFILMSVTSVFGQQETQYTQYMYNMNVLNLAYAGFDGVMSLGLLGRSQWVGVEGAPQTATFSIHSPVSNSVGLGFSVVHDEIGPVKENHINADFSYTIFTSDEARLAFGLKFGLAFLNVREFSTVDPDPLNIPVNQTAPNIGSGILYYTSKFYAGLSVPNMLDTRHLEKEAGIVSTAAEQMHYYLTSGYVFNIADKLRFKPSTMIKATAGAPWSVDLSANLLVDNRIEMGLSYRIGDSMSGLLAFKINNDFRIGYAYDHTTSGFGEFNAGSHEILLLFRFNRKNINNPRFF